MATYGKWVAKSTRIGALLGGVVGFFYAAYIMAANLTIDWTDLLQTVASVGAVLIFAVILGSLCIAIGGLAGLVLGVVASPLSSFTRKGRNHPLAGRPC